MKKMLEVEEIISNSTYDPILESLTERVHVFLIQRQEVGKSFDVSNVGKEFFQEVLLRSPITFLPEE